MKKLSKRIFVMLTSLTLLSGISMPTIANAQKVSSLDNHSLDHSIDLSIQKEESMIDDILTNFPTQPVVKTRSTNTDYFPEAT